MGKETFTSEWFETPADLIDAHKLEPLDVVSFKRTDLIPYRHFAVVLSPVTSGHGSVTDFNCVHITDVDGLTSGMKKLRIQTMAEIAADGSIFGSDSSSASTPSKIRIHNTCERKDEGSKERIEKALKMDGQEIKYEVLWANCEHFANGLRSELRFSEEILNAGIGLVNLGANLIRDGFNMESIEKNVTNAYNRWDEK